ncbi:hypothetical protein BUALT_Bualt03G0199300 [Buddleja alternifolia]|uniref:Uncharacterized protein n=1 Tax=Buddleja alternifolia TaxID=168488 RepID=A0AAV6XXE8_9LAMI|nr:hypothetical protein BUALT_Bualt03G0199300 [Buddleja alternifolia]
MEVAAGVNTSPPRNSHESRNPGRVKWVYGGGASVEKVTKLANSECEMRRLKEAEKAEKIMHLICWGPTNHHRRRYRLFTTVAPPYPHHRLHLENLSSAHTSALNSSSFVSIEPPLPSTPETMIFAASTSANLFFLLLKRERRGRDNKQIWF